MPNTIDESFLDDTTMDDENKLDAYGHLSWTIDTSEDPVYEWMACFDAVYISETNQIEYEVVVDDGSSVSAPVKGVFLACDTSAVSELRNLPETWYNNGLEQGLVMSEMQLIDTRISWNLHIDCLAALAISEEEMEVIDEQYRQARECRP